MLLGSVAENTVCVVSILAYHLLNEIGGKLRFRIRIWICFLGSLVSFILKLNCNGLLSLIVDVL